MLELLLSFDIGLGVLVLALSFFLGGTRGHLLVPLVNVNHNGRENTLVETMPVTKLWNKPWKNQMAAHPTELVALVLSGMGKSEPAPTSAPCKMLNRKTLLCCILVP